MISHRPSGRGHPYDSDPDERVPLRPRSGEQVELRATALASDGELALEVDLGHGVVRVAATHIGPAAPTAAGPYGRTAEPAGAGHLSTAATRDDEFAGLEAWVARLTELPDRFRYRFVAAKAATDWFDVAVCRWRESPGSLRLEADATVAARLLEHTVASLGDGEAVYAVRFALRLRSGERVVGFGERFDSLDQRGRVVDTRVYDQYKSQGSRSYLPMPFAIVCGAGFGFHVETSRRCFFDVGATDPDELRVEVELEPGVREPDLRLRLYEGEPYEVLRAFVDETAPAMAAPPSWTYRLWLSGNEWDSQARVLAEIEQARAASIPVGAVVIEAWSDEQTFFAFNDSRFETHDDGSPHGLADFEFPADGRWPDPRGLVETLHEAGIKVLLWQIPLLQSDEGQAGIDKQVMLDRGYAVRDADGHAYRNPGGWFRDAFLLDFTNPVASDWWLQKRRYLIEEVGVDGFKTDGGEHAWPADLRYADGSRGGETNNRYPLLYTAAYQRLLSGRGKHPVTFSRAGFTGAGACPWHWAGDADSTWEAFRAAITAGLTASASGVFFWGWDLGGFSGPLPTAELYLRATAMAALSPLMQLHSEFNWHRQPPRDRTPWNVQAQTGDERVVPIFRRFAELRERLVPYLGSAGEQAVAEGKPLLRALALDHPRDENVWRFPYEYTLGDALLVAPVCAEGASAWVVYLPRGRWVDVWEEREHEGGRIVECDASLDRIPVFCRPDWAESLVPLFDVPAERSREPMEVS